MIKTCSFRSNLEKDDSNKEIHAYRADKRRNIIPDPPSPDFLHSQMTQKRSTGEDALYDPHIIDSIEADSGNVLNDLANSSQFEKLERTIYEDDYTLEQTGEVERVKRKLFNDEINDIAATPISRRIPERMFSCISYYFSDIYLAQHEFYEYCIT